jgi:hypothetical protein
MLTAALTVVGSGLLRPNTPVVHGQPHLLLSAFETFSFLTGFVVLFAGTELEEHENQQAESYECKKFEHFLGFMISNLLPPCPLQSPDCQ